MIIAYSLTPDDDDSYMLGDDTYSVLPSAGFYDWRFGIDGVAHPATCQNCGRKTDKNFINPKYRVKKRKRHITGTYDGYDLVSKQFRAFCQSHAWKGMTFVPLSADHDFYVLRLTKILTFDARRRQTRFQQYCRKCRSYFDVVGADPVMLSGRKRPIRSGFYRTDLEFGSGHEQSPVIVMGIETAQLITDKFDLDNAIEPIEN